MASAYEFHCDMSLEEMLKALNEIGSWKWTLRDSHWYGDYLNCRPEEGVRVRIHHPAEFFVPQKKQPPKNYYTALFTIESKAAATQDAIDEIFRKLLNQLKARNLTEIEHYD